MPTVALTAALLIVANSGDSDRVALDAEERSRILQHSPVPDSPRDETNRFQNDARAARLGRFLFFDTRLSGNGNISCATCHDPARSFTDGKQVSEGLAVGDRHTLSLWNVSHNRWYFWDGRADTLWGQTIGPMESPQEMDGNRVAIARLVSSDDDLRNAYQQVFGAAPDLSDASRFPDARPLPQSADHPHHVAWQKITPPDRETVNRVVANVGKALAAYESQLVSRNSPFDRFAAQLRDGKPTDAISAAAQRGLKLFVGKANCRQCHPGPLFTDGEFHNIRVPPRAGGEPKDAGRFRGIDLLSASPFNAGSALSDARDGSAAKRLKFLVKSPDLWGAFKTPSLRNVAKTAPYMHQGQFATLRDVLEYYSTLEGAVVMGHHPETVLKPLFLSDEEIDDLIAFLESLTDESLDPALRRAPKSP